MGGGSGEREAGAGKAEGRRSCLFKVAGARWRCTEGLRGGAACLVRSSQWRASGSTALGNLGQAA